MDLDIETFTVFVYSLFSPLEVELWRSLTLDSSKLLETCIHPIPTQNSVKNPGDAWKELLQAVSHWPLVPQCQWPLPHASAAAQ